MARPKGTGLERDVPFTLRLKKKEKKSMAQSAKAQGLSMVEYARCKIFDVPFTEATRLRDYSRMRKPSDKGSA